MARPIIVKILAMQVPPIIQGEANVFTNVNTFAGVRFATNVVGSDYDLTTLDFALGMDATDDNRIIQLPPAMGYGQVYYLYKVDTTENVVDVLPDGTDLINGSISISLQDQYSDCILMDVAFGNWANILS